MCSVSWKWRTTTPTKDPILSVYFNRDEQKTRPQAHPPALRQGQSSTYLSPIDPLRGGTWLSATRSGLVICLLNNYSVPVDPQKEYASRGSIVTSLSECQDRTALDHQLKKLLQAAQYPAFSLLVFCPDSASVHFFQWDETQLQQPPLAHQFFTSSSWNTEAVQHERLQSFLESTAHNQLSHEEFHHTTPEGKELSSVFMEREKTMTVSRTYIYVYDDRIEMHYYDRLEETVHKSSTVRSSPTIDPHG